MKINDSASIRSASGIRKRAGTSGASGVSFEGLLNAAESSGAAEAGSVNTVGGIGSIDSMLALQSISEEEASRREAVQQGHSMLDSLENLRSALLTGRVPPEVIRELDARLARQRATTSDPKLLEIMDDIELRVAVEKAKLEQMAALNGIIL